MDLYLGIDIGTSSCKSSIITSKGKLLATSSSSYSDPTGIPQWKEQSPELILREMVNAVLDVQNKINASPEQIKAISIGCALHGIMAVDNNGDPLTKIFTWADDRATVQAKTLKDSDLFNQLYEQTGCPSHSMYPLYKIIWLRENNPEIFYNTAKFISVKEFIIEKLCSEYIIDYSIASGTSLLNIHTHNWNKLSLEIAEINKEQLSTLTNSKTKIIITSNELTTILHLPENTPLILGSSDAGNSNLGAGSVSPNQATCMIGTSGAYRIISPIPILDKNASSWCYCLDEENWLVGGAINNGGLAISWLKDILQSVTKEKLTFKQLLSFAEESKPGSDGVVCLPFFAGERSPNWNPDSRAVFFGLSIDHDIRHISRSILEGIAFRLRSVDEIFINMNIDIQEIRASGGYTKSDFWVQLLTDILGRSISIPEEGETSCYGAALWCFLAINPSLNLLELGKIIEIKKTFIPDQKNNKSYNKLYKFYKKIYASISPLFGQSVNF